MFKGKTFLIGALFLTSIAFIIFNSCDTGIGGGTNDPQRKVIVESVPANINTLVDNDAYIYIFQVGSLTNMVGAAHLLNTDIIVEGSGPYTFTIPLYIPNTSNIFTNSGTFDVYISLKNNTYFYKESSVSFASEYAKVDFSACVPLIHLCPYSNFEDTGTSTHYAITSINFNDALFLLNGHFGTSETVGDVNVNYGSTLSSGTDWVILELKNDLTEVRLVQCVEGVRTGCVWY
jgi:hypothetical protein